MFATGNNILNKKSMAKILNEILLKENKNGTRTYKDR